MAPITIITTSDPSVPPRLAHGHLDQHACRLYASGLSAPAGTVITFTRVMLAADVSSPAGDPITVTV